MSDAFPFLEVPEHLMRRLGKPDPGTRMYRAFGPYEAFEEWWEAVCEACGLDSSVSPGGVVMHANVSRAAVHKRLKEGRLTAFLFHRETKRRTRFLKRELIVTEGRPYVYIPVSECKAWANELRGMNRRERKQLQWGKGDHAGQCLIRKTKERPA